MPRRLNDDVNDDVLNRALTNRDGESFVGDIDRARSTLVSQGQHQFLILELLEGPSRP
jgi:hypothetical protein